jgi:hypothetical protein
MSSLVVLDPIARFAALKSCQICGRAVSPEEAACGVCGVLVHSPAHTSWPAAVKWFAAWEAARSHWHPWITEQAFFERIVCLCVNGERTGTAHPNPFGLTTSATIEQCLPLVIPLATGWRAANTPFDREQFTLPKPA